MTKRFILLIMLALQPKYVSHPPTWFQKWSRLEEVEVRVWCRVLQRRQRSIVGMLACRWELFLENPLGVWSKVDQRRKNFGNVVKVDVAWFGRKDEDGDGDALRSLQVCVCNMSYNLLGETYKLRESVLNTWGSKKGRHLVCALRISHENQRRALQIIVHDHSLPNASRDAKRG